MRQSNGISLLLIGCFLAGGCGRTAPNPAPSAAHTSTQPAGTIVCLSPAGTDLLVAMGLQSRIVGISGYEANDDLRKKLPNVGDYQRIDWERLDDLKPAFLIIQGRADRLPGGIVERCQAMKIIPIVLSIDRITDINKCITQLGNALGQETAARTLNARLDAELAQVRQSVKTRMPVLMVLNDEGTEVVGRDNFINDALEAAGGENVITASGYPSIDKEKFLTLHPAAIFLLLPLSTDAVIARAKKILSTDNTPATHIFAIRNENVLLPGTAVIALAQQFADDLKAIRP